MFPHCEFPGRELPGWMIIYPTWVCLSERFLEEKADKELSVCHQDTPLNPKWGRGLPSKRPLQKLPIPAARIPSGRPFFCMSGSFLAI